jgi:hypothetical protein
MRKGQEPPQERDARSYGDQTEMQELAPQPRMKRRSKRGLVKHGRRRGKR